MKAIEIAKTGNIMTVEKKRAFEFEVETQDEINKKQIKQNFKNKLFYLTYFGSILFLNAFTYKHFI